MYHISKDNGYLQLNLCLIAPKILLSHMSAVRVFIFFKDIFEMYNTTLEITKANFWKVLNVIFTFIALHSLTLILIGHLPLLFYFLKNIAIRKCVKWYRKVKCIRILFV